MRIGNGFDIASDRVITEIRGSNPYAAEATRNGLTSKAGDKFQSWALAVVGMSVGDWRKACSANGWALYLDSPLMRKTIMLGDPPAPAPEPVKKVRKAKVK